MLLAANIRQEQSRAENFSANELAVVDHVGVDVEDVIDVNDVLRLLRLGLDLRLERGRRRLQQRLGNFIFCNSIFLIVGL